MDKVSRPTFFLSGIRTSKKSISPLYNIEFLSWEKEKKGIQQWGSCDCPPARPFSNAEPEQRPVMYFLIFTLSLSFSLLLDVFIIIIIIVESIMIPFSPWRWGMASGFIVVCRESPPVCILDLLFSIRSLDLLIRWPVCEASAFAQPWTMRHDVDKRN